MGFILFFFLIIIYFVPGVVASWRNHKNTLAIGMLNFFLGWTFIGWVIALVWAVTDDGRPKPKRQEVEPQEIPRRRDGKRRLFDD